MNYYMVRAMGADCFTLCSSFLCRLLFVFADLCSSLRDSCSSCVCVCVCVCQYHGGNHYDRTAAAGLTNKYADGVNFHSDGLPNEPKKSHLQSMHFAIAQVAHDLVTHDAQYRSAVILPWRYNATQPWSKGTDQTAFTYGSTVFVESDATVFLQLQYNGTTYDMAPHSILILQNGALVWNSSDVKPVNVERVNKPLWSQARQWLAWTETVFDASQRTPADLDAGLPVWRFSQAVEQLNLTQDLTEYCWYSLVVQVPTALTSVNLTVQSGTAQAFVIYIDDKHVGDCYNQVKSWPYTGGWTCHAPIGSVTAGQHTLSLMSVALGIENGMGEDENPPEHHHKGIVNGGTVLLGSMDISHGEWEVRPYLVGEFLAVPSTDGHSAVSWTSPPLRPLHAPLTWYYTTFDEVVLPTDGLYSVLLDMRGMGRGHAYVNGHDIGRYWLIEGGNTGFPTQWYTAHTHTTALQCAASVSSPALPSS